MITFAISSGDHEEVKKSWMPTLNCFPALSFHRVANPRVDRSIKKMDQTSNPIGVLLEFQRRIILAKFSYIWQKRFRDVCQ